MQINNIKMKMYCRFFLILFLIILSSCGVRVGYVKIPYKKPLLDIDHKALTNLRIAKGIQRFSVLVRFYNPRQLQERPEETMICNAIGRSLITKANVKNRTFVNEMLSYGGAGINDAITLLKPDLTIRLTLQEDHMNISNFQLETNAKKHKLKQAEFASSYNIPMGILQAQLINNSNSTVIGKMTYYFIPFSTPEGTKFFVKRQKGGQWVLIYDKKTLYNKTSFKLYDAIDEQIPEFYDYLTTAVEKLFPAVPIQ